MEVGDLLSEIRVSMREVLGSRGTVAVAYSGGLDSSIVARIARESSEVKCYAAGFPSSHDHEQVERLAEEETIDVELLTLEPLALGPLMIRASAALRSRDPIRISYTVPVIRVIEACKEDLVLVGSGADELFGGYAKYSTMADPSSRMRSDLERALAEIDGLDAVARELGKRVGAPLASERIRAAAERIPTPEKVRGVDRKIALRAVAKELGLASHSRPKKAAQYSSGVLKEMKQLARTNHMDLASWTEMMLEKGLAPTGDAQST